MVHGILQARVVQWVVNKRVWNAVLGCNLKNDRMISVHFPGKPFNITVIQAYAPASRRSWSWTVVWRPCRRYVWRSCRDLLELTPKKDVLFIIGDWNAKVGSQETPGVNRQIWPWNTEWSRAKTTEFCQENALVITNTLFQQHKRRLYTWRSPDSRRQNQIDYILCSLLF